MNRTVNCNGSVQLLKDVPHDDSIPAMEGNAAHEIAAMLLQGTITSEADVTGKLASNGIAFNSDMFNAALIYYNFIITTYRNSLAEQIFVEDKFLLPEIHPDCTGTCDCWFFDKVNMTLYIFDFKYGFLPVSAVWNYQLMSYALGALNEVTNGKGLTGNSIKIKFNIVQPRYYMDDVIQEFECIDTDLRPYINKMNYACDISATDKAQLQTGKHCLGCDASHKCTALQTSGINVIDYAANVTETNLTPAALGYELKLLRQAQATIKYRYNALEQLAMNMIRAGKSIPYWYTEQTYKNRSWNNNFESISGIGKVLSLDLKRPDELITPAKALELLARNNLDPGLLDAFFERKPSSIKLQYDDGSKAKYIFGKQIKEK